MDFSLSMDGDTQLRKTRDCLSKRACLQLNRGLYA